MKIKKSSLKNLKKSLLSAVERKDAGKLAGIDPADIADLLQQLEIKQQLQIFNALTFETSLDVFENLEVEFQARFLEAMPQAQAAEILNKMAPDNRVEIFRHLPGDRTIQLLSIMNPEEASDVTRLLRYGENTAGGRMTTEFISIRSGMTARQALVKVQNEANSRNLSNIYAVYAADSEGRLVSGLSLQSLIAADPSDKIEDIARPVDKIKVVLNEDQEQVAHLFSHYDLLSVPVVDGKDNLVGVITVDDVIDVINQETSEDMAFHAGIDEIDYDTENIAGAVKTRAPWLMTSFAGGLAAAVLIGFFEGALAKVAALAVFIPVIMDMGGNVGVQSSTVVVRRLALAKGETNWRESIAGEIRAGLIMSVGFGALLWGFTSMRYSQVPRIAWASGLGISAALAISTCLGAFLPVIFHKKNIDPAVSTGPLITTAIDVLGLGIYFLLALWLVL